MEFYLFFIVKFLTGFFILIVYFNLSGKTQLLQLTQIDFIGNFVLGGIIGGVIYTESIPYYQYVTMLIIGVLVISLLNCISKRIHLFRSLTIGEPIPIIKNGAFLMDNILEKRNKIDILNISSQLHAQGVCSFQEVFYAQIEPNGLIAAVCDGSKMPSVIVMKMGKPRLCELNMIDKDEEWLKEKLEENKVTSDDVFIAEFWDGEISFIMNDGKVIKESD